MEFDQVKFFNLLLEKTNQKLNNVANQNIVLEVQLQLALEVTNQLKAETERLKEEIAKLSNKKEKKQEPFIS